MNQQDQFNQELLEFQTSNQFPKQDIPLMFHEWAKIALAFVPMAKNNISGDEFIAMCNKEADSDYTLFEFGIMLQSLEGRTMNDMQLTVAEYADFLDTLSKMRSIYMGYIQPEAIRIQRKMSTMNAIQNPGAKKIPIGKA